MNACRVFFRMWPSATFIFNHTPCLGFVLFSGGFFSFMMHAGCFSECGLRPHSFLITLLVLALCCFLVVSSYLWIPAGRFSECGLQPHSYLITLLVLGLCCFLVASSNLWFACRVFFGMWPSTTVFFNHTLVWALCCFLVASSNVSLPAGCFLEFTILALASCWCRILCNIISGTAFSRHCGYYIVSYIVDGIIDTPWHLEHAHLS